MGTSRTLDARTGLARCRAALPPGTSALGVLRDGTAAAAPLAGTADAGRARSRRTSSHVPTPPRNPKPAIGPITSAAVKEIPAAACSAVLSAIVGRSSTMVTSSGAASRYPTGSRRRTSSPASAAAGVMTARSSVYVTGVV